MDILLPLQKKKSSNIKVKVLSVASKIYNIATIQNGIFLQIGNL
jgi:hypothetical protein